MHGYSLTNTYKYKNKVLRFIKNIWILTNISIKSYAVVKDM